MSKILNKILVILSVSILIVFPASCVFFDKQAEQQAKEHCSRFSSGGSFEVAVAESREVGEERLRHIGTNIIVIGFVGIAPFSGHVCEIVGEDGTIVEVGYLKVD